MANSTRITPARVDILQGDVVYKRPASESALSKVGAGMNYIMDSIFYDLTFNWSSSLNAQDSILSGLAGGEYIEKQAKISSYLCHVAYTGDSGSNIFNFKIYDGAGAFVGNLFGAAANNFLVGGQAKSNVVVGIKNIETTPVDINVNVTGLAHQHGILNYTTLLAGWQLVPFLEANAHEAVNAKFKIRLKED